MSQSNLHRAYQIPAMINECLPKITLVQCEDGEVQVHDGHHRLVAYWLSGRRNLQRHEYILLQQDNYNRGRFGKIEKLLTTIWY